jgi:hypothetical protein
MKGSSAEGPGTDTASFGLPVYLDLRVARVIRFEDQPSYLPAIRAQNPAQVDLILC